MTVHQGITLFGMYSISFTSTACMTTACMKIPNATFHKGREHRETNFVLLFSTYIQSLKNQRRKNLPASGQLSKAK